MRSWWVLYKKELSSMLFFFTVGILLILAWHLFLLYKVESWPFGLAFGLSFLPFSAFPLVLMWVAYQSFRQEWKDDTIYFLLSLPRPGWQLTLSKLAAGLTFYVSITVFTSVSIFSFFFRKGEMIFTLPEYITSAWIVDIIIKSFLAYLLFGVGIYIISQFSQLISQFFDRFKGLISIIVFILSSYLVFRGGSLLGPFLKWLPDIPFQIFNESYGIVSSSTLYLGSGPLIGTFLLLIFIYLLGSWLLEKHLEV